MIHEEFKSAAEYWDKKDANSVKMDREKLLEAMEEYILANNTCALATGYGDFVRCTPIEYSYFDGCFWMFTEGGHKFVALENNNNVCLAIYDKYIGFGKIKGMQVSGKVEIIEPFSEAYVKAVENKKIPLEAFKKLPHPMNLLCVKPTRIDYLNSDFKKDGFNSRQSVEFDVK